jgi:predicted enzyme related to lactoylglutathione lyase
VVRDVGALVLFTARVDAVVAFYRALGVPLEAEEHGDGVRHFACELGATHFAVFAAPAGDAPEHRSGGSQFFGLSVASAEAAVAAAKARGAPVVEPPTRYAWGVRALVRDPDGRTVELFQRPGAKP